jgi:3'-phosphoadenosine 5'-phosphosulfate sulfotransferase (PAPS reductase)/FAD synthetase
MPEKWVLTQMQMMPLRAKVGLTETRIIEWYDHFDGKVCVSFSGGKDSTVLAHLVHGFYPHIPLVFANTGLEYPEIQAFARKMGAEFVHPKMRFDEVISKYGYPIISKENAEAIYYARRIRNSLVCTYRERAGAAIPQTVQKRDELTGERKTGVKEQLATANGGGRFSTKGKA